MAYCNVDNADRSDSIVCLSSSKCLKTEHINETLFSLWLNVPVNNFQSCQDRVMSSCLLTRHHENMSVNKYPPIPHFHWVCSGIPIFLIFDPKHRLWLLVKTASARQFFRVPTINVLNIYIKKSVFHLNFQNLNIKKYLYIAQIFVNLYHGVSSVSLKDTTRRS